MKKKHSMYFGNARYHGAGISQFLAHLQGDSKKCPTFVLFIFHKLYMSREQPAPS